MSKKFRTWLKAMIDYHRNRPLPYGFRRITDEKEWEKITSAPSTPSPTYPKYSDVIIHHDFAKS